MANDPQSTSSNPEKKFTRQAVKTELHQVPFNDLTARPEDYAFRDDGDLAIKGDQSKLKALSEDIATTRGIHTPILVRQQEDGKYLLLDGHRRYYATELLVNQGVDGFDRATLTMPANVITSEASELEMVARAVSANVQRQRYSGLGRIRAATRLKQLGMPDAEISRILGVSESTISRDLIVGGDDQIMDHIRQHHLTASDAARLMGEADNANMVAEWKGEFVRWLRETEAEIQDRQEWLAQNDKAPLSEAQTWPQKYLKREQVDAWCNALKQKKAFQTPTFRFKALIEGKRGQQKIEIGSLSKEVADLSAKDLAKVLKRCVSLSAQLKPLIEEKRQTESTDEEDQSQWDNMAEQQLRDMGFGDLVEGLTEERLEETGTDGEDDAGFDATEPRDEEDATATAILPEDEQADEQDA